MKVEVATLDSLSLIVCNSPYGLCGRKATLSLTPCLGSCHSTMEDGHHDITIGDRYVLLSGRLFSGVKFTADSLKINKNNHG